MASGNYFKNFQFTEYKFGDNTAQFDLFNCLLYTSDAADE